MAQCPAHAQLRDDAGASEGDVAADGLAHGLAVGAGVADVVGRLIGLPERFAEAPPHAGLRPAGRGAHHGGAGEERAGLLAVIGRKVGGGLAFPGLTRDDAGRCADGARQDRHQRAHARRHQRRAGQRLESQDDQRVAAEHRDAFVEAAVHRRLAATQVGVVETGEVVMDQRGAVHEFDGGGGGVDEGAVVLAAGGGDRQGQARTDAGAAREYRVTHRCSQTVGAGRAIGAREGSFEGFLDPS